MQTAGLKQMENGQWDMDFRMADGAEADVQALEIELGSHTGEWFVDQSHGTDQTIFNDKHTEEEIAAEVTRVILNDPLLELVGTVNVIKDMVNRHADVSFVVQHKDGTISERQVLL